MCAYVRLQRTAKHLECKGVKVMMMMVIDVLRLLLCTW